MTTAATQDSTPRRRRRRRRGASAAALAAELARTQTQLAELETRLAAAEREVEAVRSSDDKLLFGRDAFAATPPPRPVIELVREYEPGEEYWLCRCEGFRVDACGRRLGKVVGIRFGSRLDRPDALEVRRGTARGAFLVAVGDVESVDPAARCVTLRCDPRADGAVRRLVDRLI